MAQLRTLGLRPLELRGTGFVPGEAVTVTVSLARRTWTRAATADAGGELAVRFDAVHVERAAGTLDVSAVGSRGSRVGWRLNQPV
jgi:hypothetical protein